MKRVLAIVAGCVAVFAILFIAFVGYIIYYYTVPAATFIATSGVVGDVTIGETKEAILAKMAMSKQEISLDPKPQECPLNWIKIYEMSDTQRSCLLKTDRWQEGFPSTTALCPERTNVFTDLRFDGGKLASVTTTCRHPE